LSCEALLVAETRQTYRSRQAVGKRSNALAICQV
jgi:hypothetical protein